MISLADMIEARGRIPGCERLEAIDRRGENWLDNVPRPTRIRLLRILLPSAKELPSFTWRRDFQACFRGRHAPYLTALNVDLGDDVAGFSGNVLEAVPALEKISIKRLRTNSARGTLILRGSWRHWKNLAVRHAWRVWLLSPAGSV